MQFDRWSLTHLILVYLSHWSLFLALLQKNLQCFFQNMNEQLKPGQLYAVDGGVFQCKEDEETGEFSLSTYLGREGHVVLRVGFEICEDGRLFDRIYDYEAEQVEVVDFRGLSISDLRAVSRGDVLEDNPAIRDAFARLIGEGTQEE